MQALLIEGIAELESGLGAAGARRDQYLDEATPAPPLPELTSSAGQAVAPRAASQPCPGPSTSAPSGPALAYSGDAGTSYEGLDLTEDDDCDSGSVEEGGSLYEQLEDDMEEEEGEDGEGWAHSGLGCCSVLEHAAAAAAAGAQTDTIHFAEWETHGRGIASKLMAGMGYVSGESSGGYLFMLHEVSEWKQMVPNAAALHNSHGEVRRCFV